MLKITILYDNTAWRNTLTADWGFACLVQTPDKKILFDTGAKGPTLLDNMQKLQVDPLEIDTVFISHDHWDHTGGLVDFLKINPVTVYLPHGCINYGNSGKIVRIADPMEIFPGIYSTGELHNIEQSLVIKEKDGVVVVTGCSHPGVQAILSAASTFGNVTAIVGGLHGFDDFGLLENLETVCPTHCTRHIEKIESLFPATFTRGGAGKVIEM